MLKTRYKGLELIKDNGYWKVENRFCKDLYSMVDFIDKNARTCDTCGRAMQKGYVIENGLAYHCSDECLHKCMSEEDYEELYEDGDSYWTEWESVFYEDITEIIRP